MPTQLDRDWEAEFLPRGFDYVAVTYAPRRNSCHGMKIQIPKTVILQLAAELVVREQVDHLNRAEPCVHYGTILGVPWLDKTIDGAPTQAHPPD